MMHWTTGEKINSYIRRNYGNLTNSYIADRMNEKYKLKDEDRLDEDKVHTMAHNLGLKTYHKGMWTPKEVAIVTGLAFMDVATILAKLTKEGFTRTFQAVQAMKYKILHEIRKTKKEE